MSVINLFMRFYLKRINKTHSPYEYPWFCRAFYLSKENFHLIDPVGPLARPSGKHYIRSRWLFHTGTAFNALLDSTDS